MKMGVGVLDGRLLHGQECEQQFMSSYGIRRRPRSLSPRANAADQGGVRTRRD